MIPSTLEIARTRLFDTEDALRHDLPEVTVARLLRLREMYTWFLSNPDAKDRRFVEELQARHGLSRSAAYEDLAIVKTILPNLSAASRDFHRWRYNEMILETYAMAKKRKDTKTMERAATSYAKYNCIDQEDEMAVPYDEIVVQPFTPTDDPAVLGIRRIPNLDKVIADTLARYSVVSEDIEDVQFEEADLMENVLFAPEEKDG